MLSSLVALALAATAADATMEGHAGAAAQGDVPLLVARADGGWTITRVIHEEPAALEMAANELLRMAVRDLRFAGELGEREALREIDVEDPLERAFEEAVDATSEAAAPQ